MVSFDLLILVSVAYVGLLFLTAFWAERRAASGRGGWLRSPLIYTLSLSIYCTAWTFYGAVGYAARSGLEFLTIYLGPTGVMIGWWLILRRMVQVGRAQRVTSVADLISSRFGKSATLGGFVTLLAVLGTTPYIALQLQSVTLSFGVFAGQTEGLAPAGAQDTAFWVAAGLAFFTILFGTRNLDVNERHHGVVLAIAIEAIVKLVALMAVGIFVVWGLSGGVAATLAKIDQSPIAAWQVENGRWVGLTFLSAAAFLTLPRMFQVLVVENEDESHLATAAWAFPLYLLMMSLFVVPIAVMGLELMPAGSNPDLFVLTLPLAEGQEGLAMLAFLGGFSSATSMVIVAAIALATMVSNHIVLPLWLSFRVEGASMSGDVRNLLLTARRVSIAVILALGYIYYRMSGGGTALASIGLISFAGVAQALPAMLGGIFWRGATRVGALAGLSIGFAVWAYALFLPSFGTVFSDAMMQNGPFGIGWLRPQALFGISGLDPLVHAVFWSMMLNALAFVLGSVLSFPTPLERIQGVQFTQVATPQSELRGWQSNPVEAEDLLVMAQRILGPDEAQALFQAEADTQGVPGYLPEITPAFLAVLERRLAGSVGAATAHAMVEQIAGGAAAVSVEDLMAVADEAAQIMEYSNQLEAKSDELSRTARQLREANEQLTQVSLQKDSFLSQISHELRTPMTSIRAFSEILQSGTLEAEDRSRYADIIHSEAQRLTRLLDDLLDLSVLENGQVSLNISDTTLREVLDHAITVADTDNSLHILRKPHQEAQTIATDPQRLAQVFMNLITNAQKYCQAAKPRLTIQVHNKGDHLQVDFIDNGKGIAAQDQRLIFEKFSRLSDTTRAGGTGLGLAICYEIMANLGGSITYLPGQRGAAFRVTIPVRQALAAQ